VRAQRATFAMHRALVMDNKLCYQRDVERKQLIHKNKLETMKSTAKSNSCHQMDNNRPKRHKHLEQNAKRRQLEDEHYAKIERENRILIEKMYSIMNAKSDPNAMEFQPGLRLNSNQVGRGRGREVRSKVGMTSTGGSLPSFLPCEVTFLSVLFLQGPIVDCYLSPRSNFPGSAVPHKSLNEEARRREHEKIMEENQQILKRLQEKKPVYSTKALQKERKIVEGYMANISNSTTTGYLSSPRLPSPRGVGGGSYVSSWNGSHALGSVASDFRSVSAGGPPGSGLSGTAQLAPIRPKGKKRVGAKSAREAKLGKKSQDVAPSDSADKDTTKIGDSVASEEAKEQVIHLNPSLNSTPLL
jgi:hypothetical protein